AGDDLEFAAVPRGRSVLPLRFDEAGRLGQYPDLVSLLEDDLMGGHPHLRQRLSVDMLLHFGGVEGTPSDREAGGQQQQERQGENEWKHVSTSRRPGMLTM